MKDVVKYMEQALDPRAFKLGTLRALKESKPFEDYDDKPNEDAIKNLEEIWRTRPLKPPPVRIVEEE